MRSPNKKAQTSVERDYVRMVKLCSCSVCGAGGGESAPSEAHEIEQGKWFLSVALCESCHRGPVLGLHGQRRMWAIKKMSELDALGATISQVMEQIRDAIHVRGA